MNISVSDFWIGIAVVCVTVQSAADQPWMAAFWLLFAIAIFIAERIAEYRMKANVQND